MGHSWRNQHQQTRTALWPLSKTIELFVPCLLLSFIMKNQLVVFAKGVPQICAINLSGNKRVLLTNRNHNLGTETLHQEQCSKLQKSKLRSLTLWKNKSWKGTRTKHVKQCVVDPKTSRDAFVLSSCLGARRMFTMRDFFKSIANITTEQLQLQNGNLHPFFGRNIAYGFLQVWLSPPKPGPVFQVTSEAESTVLWPNLLFGALMSLEEPIPRGFGNFLLRLVVSSVTQSVNHSAHLLQLLGVVTGNTNGNSNKPM